MNIFVQYQNVLEKLAAKKKTQIRLNSNRMCRNWPNCFPFEDKKFIELSTNFLWILLTHTHKDLS